jgi:hypothetical protein
MTMHACTLAYDLIMQGFNWWLPMLGMGAGALGFFFLKVRYESSKSKILNSLPFVALLVGVVWSILVFADTFKEYYHLKARYTSGNFRIVEGVVSQFKGGDDNRGGAFDSFVVSGVHFSIEGNSMSSGFKKMRSMGTRKN